MANIFQDLSAGAVGGASFYGQAQTTNVAGASVDFADCVGNRQTAILLIGAVSGTSPTNDVKVQHSTDGTTWADVPGATFTQATTAGGAQVISFNATRRYVRGYATFTGTSPSFGTGLYLVGQRRTTPGSNGGYNTASSAAVT